MKMIVESCAARSAQRSVLAIACLSMLLSLPSTGFAYDLTVGLDLAYVHDSNFFRDPNDEESDYSVEPGGTVALEHEGARFNYLAKYIGSYQMYDKYDDADGADHRVRLKGGYDIDRLTSIQLKNNFKDVRNQRFNQDDIRDGDTGQDPADNRYQRNDLELILHRDISSTWEMQVNATQQFIDFNRNETRSDSDSVGVGGRVFHRFSPRHRVGGGLSWVNQDFDGDNIRLDAEAEFVVADLAWIFDIGEQIQLVVNGGPAWVSTEEDSTNSVQQTQFVGGDLGDELFRANVLSCDFDDVTATGIASRCNSDAAIPANSLGSNQSFPLQVNTPIEDEDEVTFFGGAALEGRFSDWTVFTDLQRKQSRPSGDSIAAKLTRMRWEFGYAPPLATWDAYLAGSWERREAFSNSTIIDYVVVTGPEDAAQRSEAFTRKRDSGDRRDDFTALVGVRRQFTRNLSGDIGASYRHTDRRASGRDIETDTYFFAVKVSYVFDTFHF